jgi:glutaconyl-CoA decarboxylase
MKKQIRFQFKGTLHTVDVERDGNELTLESSGVTYQVTLLPEEGAAKKPSAAKAHRKSRPAPVAAVAKSGPAVAPAAAAPPAPASPQPAAAVSANTLTAPLTGVVKEIKAAEGRKVEAGEVVIVMEAMKMDIDINAQASGTVQEVYVRQGDSVSANQQLMKIE